jgi:Tfp pilus assembly protein PilF
MYSYRIIRSIASRLGMAVLLLAIAFMMCGCASVRQSGCDEILSVGGSSSEQSNVHYLKGVRMFDHGKLPAAEEAFERAISLDYENGSAHNNLGLIYYQQRKLPEAASEFEIATQMMPEDATPWNNLGMTLEAAGKGHESLEYYHQAYELSPRKSLYLGNLVRTRIRLGENDESVIEQLRELLFIEKRPEWIEWTNDQLALKMNPNLDRGPAPPNLDSKNKKKQAATKANELPDPGLRRLPEGMPQNHSPVQTPVQGEAREMILADPADPRINAEIEAIVPKR